MHTLLRQRRNVFISWVVLLLLIFFSKEDSQHIQNTLVEWIEIPTYVAIILVMWLFYYFCLRYIQHLLDDEILKKLYEIHLRGYKFEKHLVGNTYWEKIYEGEIWWFKVNFYSKSISWKDEEAKLAYSIDFASINRRLLLNNLRNKDKYADIYKYIYNITSFQYMFFRDVKTFLNAITNRKYWDYIFPVFFIIGIWGIIGIKIFPILMYICRDFF